MRESFQNYLCLTDLLDQDLSAYEYFQTLSPEMQTTLRREDENNGTLAELQARVAHLQSSSLMGGRSVKAHRRSACGILLGPP